MDFLARVFGLRGRIGRGAFWLIAVPWLLVIIAGQIALAAAQTIPQPKEGFSAWAYQAFGDITVGISEGKPPLVPLLFIFIAFLMFLSAVVRRLHDLGRSGLFVLVLFWPAVMFVFMQTLKLIGIDVGKWMVLSFTQYPYVFYGFVGVGTFLTLWSLVLLFEMAFRRGSGLPVTPQQATLQPIPLQKV